MECPTCFQKITVPQAPASGDQKFILTGSKVTPKKTSPQGEATPVLKAEPESKIPAIILVVVGVVLVAGAVAFYGRGKNSKPGEARPGIAAITNAGQAPKSTAAVAPAANDTNWMLKLAAVTIPEAPVAGRIHGQDFVIERAAMQNGRLILRQGTRGPVEFGVQVNFSNTPPEVLAGKSLNVLADTNKSAPVSLYWKDGGGAVQKIIYQDSYAMRLEFGAIAKGRLPGKLYLCTPDEEKSYLMGTFNANIIKPKPKIPGQPAPVKK